MSALSQIVHGSSFVAVLLFAGFAVVALGAAIRSAVKS